MSCDSGYEDLACAIVQQAVKDWRALCEKGARYASFLELVAFFKSGYCTILCEQINPLAILRQLEAERKGAKWLIANNK